MQKISTCLWFDNQAQEAADYYVSIFKNSRITGGATYPEGLPGEAGSQMTVSFVLDGREFLALNGGPVFTFTPAVSFVVNCEDQQETDYYWQKLTDGGEEGQCGWLTDKYGVSWQVVPQGVDEMLGSSDKEAAARAAKAMLPMKKLDIAEMRRAFEGR